MKKILIFIGCILLTTTAIAAEICPSPALLASKTQDFQKLGWIALNQDDDTPADPDGIDAFKKNVGNFYLAEWSADYNYGYGRCYYTGDNQLIYIASKNNMRKPQGKNPWKTNNLGTIQCYASSNNNCIF